MGQRLNIEIVKNNELLANSYYHWSGYSHCAINLAIEIINNFNYIKKYKVENATNKDLLLAIRLLEETGAGTNKSDIDETIKRIGLIDENIILKNCQGRDEGIIESSKEGMEENRYWEEGRVTIDIENHKIKFKVFDNISEEDKNEYEENGDKFKDININFGNIKFEDVFDLKALIDKSRYKKQYYFRNNFDNKYIGLIE